MGSLSRWMPTYLMSAIEKILGTRGVDLRELAILAATFEDLIHKEAAERLKDVFQNLGLSMTERVAEEQAENAIQLYMALYTTGGNETVHTVSSLHSLNGKDRLDRRTLAWLKRVQKNV